MLLLPLLLLLLQFPNPNPNASLFEAMRLEKFPISEKTAPPSKEGLLALNNFDSRTLSRNKALLDNVFDVGADIASVTVSVELSLLEWEFELRSGSAADGVVDAVAGAICEEEEGLLLLLVVVAVVVLGLLERLDLRQPPPTGTLRRTPPLVQ